MESNLLGSGSCSYFSVDPEPTDDGVRLSLKGELDLNSASLVTKALADLEAQGTDPIILDLEGLSFLDCSGLSVLVGACNRAYRDDRSVVIANVRPPVRRIFALTGCADLLNGPSDGGPQAPRVFTSG